MNQPILRPLTKLGKLDYLEDEFPSFLPDLAGKLDKAI